MSGSARETTIAAEAAAIAKGRRSLGDPTELQALFGEFAGGVIQRAVDASRAAQAGHLDAGQKAAEQDQEAAQGLIETLAGRDPAWVPLGGWNAMAEGGLRGWLREVLSEEAHPDMLAREPDGPLEALAGYLLLRLYTALGELRDGIGEEGLRETVEAIIGDGVRMALGIPFDAEFEGGAAAE